MIFLSKATLAEYVPMEPIPGTEGTAAISSFPAYVNAVYKFLVWSVGIAAMFMISIGGFMYFTAAGNTSKMESGKRVIVDAIWGLVAVMVAWVVLNTINPNLTNINLQSVESLRGAGTTPTTNQAPVITEEEMQQNIMEHPGGA